LFPPHLLAAAGIVGFLGSSKKSSSSPGIRSRLISTGFGGSGGFGSGSGFGFDENKLVIVCNRKIKVVQIFVDLFFLKATTLYPGGIRSHGP
jgi:hypothetical protein